ncbi:tyrosine-type recombinase/integrase [Sphingomonas sp. Leaf37]|uniref:tyrosine-type recombinase/integrase n=1 Tax=Sphingomonas sp. Leaf37 TaxID=2876552 RepID=UPI001E435D9F|nr:site-specific integrase [Sphingomonas sp. Leaf37]
MATGKITKRSVDAIPVPDRGKREHLWDDTLKGFGVMVTDKGARSYLVQYRIGGRGAPSRRVTIGKHGSPWTAEKARIRATELLEQVRRKDDPFDAAKAKVAADKAVKAQQAASAVVSERLGFSTFADRFVKNYAMVNQQRSWKETQGIINRDLKPALGERPLPEITDADLVELIETIGERGASPGLKAYKTLRMIFGYACDKERRHMPPAKSPMLGIKPPSKAGKRERTLSDAELRLAWMAAGGLGWPFGPIVRLLILTGQRRDEVAGLAWQEIDKAANHWLLPGERSKNGLPNLVPLSPSARAIVDDLPVIKSDAGLLFTTTGDTAVSGFSKVKARLDASMLDLMRKEAAEAGMADAALKRLKVEPWTLHDLRRTLATGCQRLGFPTEVTEAVINHVSGSRAGIVGVYQTYRYEKEKRAALEAWARHVLEAVSGRPAESNVIALERRA